ncbi:MAG: hypothetical protein AAGF13_11495 [Pseudomonadota bacterium]
MAILAGTFRVMRSTFACLFFLATAATAQDGLTPMTAAEFEAYTTGKTLSYATEGNTPYGAEEYLPGRFVRWAFTGQECKDGQWFEQSDLICFVYEDNPEPQCWSFFLTPQGLRAQFENRDGMAPLYQINESAEPLFCPGPQIGV